MAIEVKHEPVSGGHAVYKGDPATGFKLAVVSTRDNRGMSRNNVGVQEPIEKALWMIHWCSPHMSVDEAAAVIDYVKGLPDEGKP